MNIFKIRKFNLGLFSVFSLIVSLVFTSRVYAVEVFNDTKQVYYMDKFVVKEEEGFKNINSEIYGDVLIDKITNDKSVIKGRSFKNSLVKFLINDIEYTINTDEDGNFTLLLEEGVLVDVDQVNVKVYDYLSNELTHASFVVHDILPPIDPQVNGVINNGDNLVKGYGEPNSSIKLLIGDEEFIGAIGGNGIFEIEVGDSLRDANSIKLVSYDYFNNHSNVIESQIRDIIPPEKPQINIVDYENNLITGSGESFCEVVVEFDGNKYKSYVDESGHFFVYNDEGELEQVDNVKVRVIDLSGNVSEEVFLKLQKENVGKLMLKSLDVDNKIIRDAMIKVNGMDDSLLNEDKIFNLNSEGNLFLEDLPFGDYELVIRYRNNENQLEENVLKITINEEQSEVEVLID